MARPVGIGGGGIIGAAMMRNLMKDGFEVVGYEIDASDGAPATPAGRTGSRRAFPP